jgi:hypothetical protein
MPDRRRRRRRRMPVHLILLDLITQIIFAEDYIA